MAPSLVVNRLLRGRFLDVLVTHAPPRGIHEGTDRAHRGFGAVRTFLQLFQPRYHFHGHTHVYDRRTPTTTQVGSTTVVNAFGARTVDIP
jgi:Icc-related predicted phosphoesterase